MKKILGSLLFLAILTPASLLAGTYTWSGASPANANLTTAANWIDPSGNVAATRPTSGDSAYFGTSARYDITANSGGLLAVVWTFDATQTYNFIKPGSAYLLQFAENPLVSLIQNGSGDVNFNAIFRFAGQRVVTGAAGSGTVSFNYDLPVNSTGGPAGALTLQGAIKVQINGTQAAGAATTNSWRLNSGSVVLGGTGTLSLPLENTLVAKHGADGATIAPGVSGTAGTLVLGGGLDLERSTNLNFDLAGVAGANDKISITSGTFTLRAPAASGKFTLNLGNLGLSDFSTISANPITLIESAPAGAVTFDFGSVTSSDFAFGNLPAGWSGNTAYGSNGINFDPGTGTLSIFLIPEPGAGTMVFLGLGIIGLFLRKRAA